MLPFRRKTCFSALRRFLPSFRCTKSEDDIMKIGITLAALTIAASTGFASAQDAGQFGVGLGVSTLGATLEGTYRFNDNFGARVQFGGVRASGTHVDGGTTTAVSVDLGGAGVLVDYYIGGSMFRISGGLMSSRMNLDTNISGSVDIDGTSYAGVDVDISLAARRTVAPVVAIGTENSLFGSNWYVSSSAGAIFNGGLAGTVTDNSGLISAADLTSLQNEVNSGLAGLNVTPYASLTIGMRF